MDPRHLWSLDKRHSGMCVYCGAVFCDTLPETSDHAPSRVLLDDEPHPPQSPVVKACKSCNASFSLDEQYLACFIECAICGTVETADLKRPKIKRILSDNPALQRRIENSRKEDEADNVIWQVEIDRVRNVILKLARGHAAYELYPKIEEPLEVFFAPYMALSEEEQDEFENATFGSLAGWPEIGSRAFLHASGKNLDQLERSGGWVVVQPERYRYSTVETEGLVVKMVLSEYLLCAVSWE